MGCLISRLFRSDEVVPVTIRPLSFTSKTDYVGTTTSPVVVEGGIDRGAPYIVEAEPHKQVVLTSRTAAPSPFKQNGAVGLTNEDRARPTRETTVPISEGGKRASAVTNQNDACIVTNQNDSDSPENKGYVQHHKDGHGTAAGAHTPSPANEKAGGSAGNRDPDHSSESTANEKDIVDSTGHAATEAPVFQMPEVEIQKVPDGEGCPITLGKLFGVWTVPWPSLPAQIMRAQFFTFHDSDVILTGYAKSGSHWVWEMVHMLMIGQAQHCRTPKERLMLSFSTQEFFDTLPPPRVFNTHAPFQGFPVALREGVNRCKMIYLLRNPKDVAVSYYHHLINQVDFEYEGTFHGYLDLFLEGKVPGGSWFDYVLGWEQTIKEHPDLSILVLHFEDVKQDTIGALQKLNEFLGVSRDLGLLREIAAMCTIHRMKAAEEELKDQGPSHVNVSKSGKNFILRKGEVGDWKNWFTQEDDRRFMEEVHTRLQHSSLHFRYLLPKTQGEDEEEEE